MINSYENLSIEKYIQLYEIDIQGMEEIDIQASMISILSDMTIDEVMELPITEYKKLAQNTAFLTEPPKVRNRKISKVNIDGKEYRVIDRIEEMLTGQYIDYQTYLSRNEVKMLPYILSCLIIPKGEKYGDSDTIEDMKRLNVKEALEISNFFIVKSRTLTRSMLRFLDWKITMRMMKTKNETMKMKLKEAIKKIRMLRHFLKNGHGFIW